MENLISRLRKDTDGAVTVDFVILTASVVGLAISFFIAIDSGTQLLADTTATSIAESTSD